MAVASETAAPAEKPIMPIREGEIAYSAACAFTYFNASFPSLIAKGITGFVFSSRSPFDLQLNNFLLAKE